MQQLYVAMCELSTLERVSHVTQLLESCGSNCGRDFQLELAKPAFHIQAKEILTSVRIKSYRYLKHKKLQVPEAKLLTVVFILVYMQQRSTDPKTFHKLAGLLISWSVEFKNDSQMRYIHVCYS